ncbi:MAG: PAS domain-containing protein, partial [Elusimicrobia bacterium]|nr:PAS domain-containing protein [Elusimicrobiota bacterium]
QEGAATLSREGLVLYGNARLAQMLKLPMEKVIANPVGSFFMPASARRLGGLLKRARKFSAELELRADGGSSLAVKVSGAWTGAGRERMACLVVTDLSDVHAVAAARLRVTLASIGDAVLATDAEGTVTFINPIAAALTGWDESEALGRPAREVLRLINEKTRKPCADIVAGVLRRKRTLAMASHAALISRDGREVPVADSAAPILDAAGRLHGAVLVFRDVTAKRRAADELKLTTERFRILTENLASGVALIDDAGRFVIVNPAFLEIFELPKRSDIRNVNDRNWADWKVFEESGALLDVDEHPVRKAARTGEAVRNRLVGVRAPASPRLKWLLISAEPTFKADGKLDAIICAYQDITAHKELQDLLRRSEQDRKIEAAQLAERQMLLDVMETLPVIITLLRPDHRLEWANRAYRDAWGDNVGKLCFAGQFGRDEPCAQCQAFTPLKTGEPHHWERTLPDGRTFDIYDFPFADTDGSRMILEMDIDITERRKVEAALREQIKEKARLGEQLQQTQKLEAVGLLAGGIAHDFNNIVSAIAGNNYFLLEDLPKASPLRAYAEEIGRSTDVAASLTRQLLAISRKQVLQPRVLDINSVLISMSRMLGRLVGEHIKVEMKPHPSLWPVTMDSGQLEQIIMNLAINARDAMRKGGTLTLATANRTITKVRADYPKATLAPGSYVCLEVRDTGVGMDAPTVKRIFEPFFTTKEAGRGTGLGLVVVERIIKHCRGSITVESKPGRGSVFSILIPSEKSGAEAMMPGDMPRPGHAGHESVLAVEDNEAFLRIVERSLTRMGYAVAAFGNAEDALAYWRKNQSNIDLLLTDIVLPGMDGTVLAQRLKEQRPGLKVIYMSGYAGEVTLKVMAADDAALLEKPFSPEKLLSTIRQILGKP